MLLAWGQKIAFPPPADDPSMIDDDPKPTNINQPDTSDLHLKPYLHGERPGELLI